MTRSGRRPHPGRRPISARTRATGSRSMPGSELIVTQQNFATTSTEALAQEGKAVRLIWKRQHELSVADGEHRWRRTRMRNRRLALAGTAAPVIAACSRSGGSAGASAAGVTRRRRRRAQPRHLVRLRGARLTFTRSSTGSLRSRKRPAARSTRQYMTDSPTACSSCSPASTTAAPSRATRLTG